MAQTSSPSPRFEEGSLLTAPVDLYSSQGRLEVTMAYQARVDSSGNRLYCFTTLAGVQSPTLHVRPGDELVIHLKNLLPPGSLMTMASMPEMSMTPPELYWYHPHIHGISEPAVLGGASGRDCVEGLEKFNPAAAGWAEQVLVIRDNLVPGNSTAGGNVPSWDVLVNYTPVPYPNFTPAALRWVRRSGSFGGW